MLIFIINCTGNKVSNYHGTKSLKKKYELIYINKLNKNEMLKLTNQELSEEKIDEFKKYALEKYGDYASVPISVIILRK